MTDGELYSLKARVSELETLVGEQQKFIIEVQSGKRVLLWLCSSIAGIIATIYFTASIWKGWHG